MSVDDSALYTGLDGEAGGTFGNEFIDEDTKQKIQEQEQLIQELTPQLEEIIEMLDGEKQKHLEVIAGYVTQAKDTDEVFRAEMKASALYRGYIDELKNKFILKLNEVKK